jgi:hypothetical protein
MQVFIFQSGKGHDIAGFTAECDGKNLPPELSPWEPLGDSAIHTGDPIAGLPGGANAVLTGIDRQGFYVGRTFARLGRFPFARGNT